MLIVWGLEKFDIVTDESIDKFSLSYLNKNSLKLLRNYEQSLMLIAVNFLRSLSTDNLKRVSWLFSQIYFKIDTIKFFVSRPYTHGKYIAVIIQWNSIAQFFTCFSETIGNITSQYSFTKCVWRSMSLSLGYQYINSWHSVIMDS